MTIFYYYDYRQFLRETFASQPKKGRGKSAELAAALRIHPTIVSQVLSGRRDFSAEQALEVCEFLKLSANEGKHFRLLVGLASAGTARLRKQLKDEIDESKKSSLALVTRVVSEKPLTDTGRAIFYSNWRYSAVRLYTSTDLHGRTLEEICSQFGLVRTRALEICQFLVSSGLCTLTNDCYQMGAQSTFVEKGSPFLMKHHANWRIKAIQASDDLADDELMFTGVMSISKADFTQLREEIAAFIGKSSRLVKDSIAEEVACLNFDFFKVKSGSTD